MEKKINTTEKFCTKCGKKFIPVGREVICPSCKAAAAEETTRADVLKAKRASWAGESVPVRISGRASTVIREYGAKKSLPFGAALDALLQSTAFFATAGQAWADIVPYKSHRRDKPQDKPQEVKQDVTKAAKVTKKVASKTSKTAKASKSAIRK